MPEKVRRLVEEIHVPEIIASILISRGIEDYETAKAFFRPGLQQLHNPFLMLDMEKAVQRVVAARSKKERVLVYADYDVDGTSSASLLYLFLRDIGCDVDVYIPDRVEEGSGISESGIEYAVSIGATLLISIDCGITNTREVAIARGKGIEVIICDHHKPNAELPEAYAVLDPIRDGDLYPFKDLPAAGVGFKLLQALAVYFELPPERAYRYLDFVAIAAAADIVPMWGENRILVHYGLRQINEDPRPGIRALIESCNLGYGDLTAQQIVFVMAPRINAVGRMGDATRAVDLLTCEDFTRAQELAQVLEEENRNRRKIDEVTFQEAQLHAAAYLAEDPSRPIVLHSDSWHPGVIGIVASRLVEKFHRPTVLLTTAPDGLAKGSARSILEFNVYEALQRCEPLLEQFGGHPFAAGLVLKVENLPAFRACFTKAAAEILNADMLTHRIEVDAELRLSDITPRFWRMLKEFAPFGPKNQRPVFVARNCEIFGLPRTVGANNTHLKMKVRQDGVVFDCIGYNLGARLPQLERTGTRVDMLFTIEENTRSGNVFQQLRLRDIRPTDDPRTDAELAESRARGTAHVTPTPAVTVSEVAALTPAVQGADAPENGTAAPDPHAADTPMETHTH